jgi:small-conductance mechanosensitive channel
MVLFWVEGGQGMTFPDYQFYNNSLQAWIWALIIFLSVVALLRISRSIVVTRLRAFAATTVTQLDDHVAELIHRSRLFFFVALAVYAGSYALVLPAAVRGTIDSITVVAVFLQIAIWGNAIVSHLVTHYVRFEMGDDASAAGAATALTFIVRLLLWALVILMALANLEVAITPLITGLGVGGIAVALAAQNILGDLFASLSIMFDKPFVIGDFIIVGEDRGSVERIGLKTTRIRSLTGELLVVSNTDLLNSRIRNYKQMYERRIVFSLAVVYQTPHDKLSRIPGMIRQIIEAQELTRVDRSHFAKYGDSSLDFETVYWVKSPDYGVYMDIQQAVNLEIYRRFESEGIEFAYPTRTLFISQEQPA